MKQYAYYGKIRLSRVLTVICIIHVHPPTTNTHTITRTHTCTLQASCRQFPLTFKQIAHLRLLKENYHFAYFNCYEGSDWREVRGSSS